MVPVLFMFLKTEELKCSKKKAVSGDSSNVAASRWAGEGKKEFNLLLILI